MVKASAKHFDLQQVYRNYEEMKGELLTRACFEIEDSGKSITFLIDRKRAGVFYSTQEYTGKLLDYIFLYRFDSSMINKLPVKYYFDRSENYSTLLAAECAMKDKTFPNWISRRTGKSYYQIRREAIKRCMAEELDDAFFVLWKTI